MKNLWIISISSKILLERRAMLKLRKAAIRLKNVLVGLKDMLRRFLQADLLIAHLQALTPPAAPLI